MTAIALVCFDNITFFQPGATEPAFPEIAGKSDT